MEYRNRELTKGWLISMPTIRRENKSLRFTSFQIITFVECQTNFIVIRLWNVKIIAVKEVLNYEVNYA